MPPTVVLDTSVLYPMILRDILLGCAEQGLFTPLWTVDIIDELRRNLIEKAKLKQQSADRLIYHMNRSVPFAPITNYQSLIPSMTNHSKDRHVLAAAVHAGTSTIVTSNLKHFSPTALAPYQIVAMSPDDFLCSLLPTNSTSLVAVVQQMANDYNKPPLSVGDILESLKSSAPVFAKLMPGYMLADQR